MPRQLSEFGFFNGSADRPDSALTGYSLRNPLFSDYAEKQRFIYLPENTRLRIAPDGKVGFPVGTALIKSFGYKKADGGLDILETRLLLHRASGWLALPYVWREDGSDADLKVGGKRIPVSFTTPRGKRLDISYGVPNKNQCKQCHSSKNQLEPIGPVWPEMIFETKATEAAFAARASFPRNGLHASAKWDDPSSGNLEDRAEAYLVVNCAGLFYDSSLGRYAASGYKKRPVAAGRGSGGHDFVVDPGHPERSILIHRMKSLDPGVAMPELGRSSVHQEGVELLEEWIASMDN